MGQNQTCDTYFANETAFFVLRVQLSPKGGVDRVWQNNTSVGHIKLKILQTGCKC